MGGKSNYLENKLIDHVFSAAFTQPGTIYTGLWTAALDDTSTGSAANEVSGGSYARVAKAGGTANWTAGSGGSISNAVAISFPQATADWGTATYFGLADASAAGNMLYWGQLTASKIIQNGDTASFAIGELDVSED